MIYLLKVFHMNSRTKGLFYALLTGAVLVPVVYMSGVDAVGTCSGYSVTGDTLASYYENTGYLDFNDSNSDVCVEEDGTVTGGVLSSNLGMIYFDQNGASVTVDADGSWNGKVYAPLNAYNLASTSGMFFFLDNVATDLETGLISGHADSVNLGELSFKGAIQELSSLTVGLDFYVETFGDTIVTVSGETIPVADGGDSGYKIVAEIDFSETPYEVTEDFLENDFQFEGRATADLANSNLRLDQVDENGSANDAVERVYNFEFKGIDGDIATYYVGDISSYAPTSDARCSYLDGELEACEVSAGDFLYFLDKMSVEGWLPRSFEWVSSGGYSVSETTIFYNDLVGYEGSSDMDISSESLSFAPMYEVDGFGVVADDGAVADSMDEVSTLAEGALYDFGGVVVKNGDDISVDADLTVEYGISDSDYTFAGISCGQETFDVGWVLDGEVLTGDIPFSDIGLCPADGASLDEDVEAVAETSFELNFADGTKVYYPSEYFSFADTRAEISENPRVYVTGTVSGLVESDDVTVVGDMGKLELKDALFEQIAKVTRGVDSDYISGGGKVNSSWERAVGGIDLSDGDVLYFVGDASMQSVLINGGEIDDGMYKTIVVVGTNVFIDGNIYREDEDGELGIVVLADEDGNGGDLYVDSDVTDLYVNIFLDGSLIRADKNGNVYGETDLKNQLYILGSIVSENTIEGYEEGASCVCGDGTECDADLTDTCTEEQATVEDLQYTSYFRVCCESSCTYDSGGNVKFPYEECSGYERSTYDGDEWSFPLIIEYSPPSSSMPIFSD